MSAKTEKLQALLFQCENIQHQRVNLFVLSETIFFISAATAKDSNCIVITCCLAGIALAIIFTIINLKNYLRILWLSESLKKADTEYGAYLEFRGHKELIKSEGLTGFTIDLLIHEPEDGPRKIKFSYTGVLLTYFLCLLFCIVWMIMLGYVFRSELSELLLFIGEFTSRLGSGVSSCP